jgi:outer membrane receptor protein involved in Fe transport
MSSSRSRIVAPAGALVLLACLLSPAALGGPPYAGRPVGEVLRELGTGELRLIYNDEIVPPGLAVTAEPAAGSPAAIARQILAAHGLGLRPVAPGTFSVVRQVAVERREAGTVAAPVSGAASAPLAEIIVTTSRYALAHDEPQLHTILTRADVQALPKFADEPLRAVQRLPGTAASGISAQAHIRGGEYDETLLVLDGLPMQEPFHLKNLLTPVTVFDAEAIGSMDVSSGGFTAEYGRAMSGVIDIATLQPPRERYTVLGLSLFHASALSAGEFAEARGHWLGSVRRSNLDLLSRLGESDVGKPKYFDAFGRVSFDLSDATTVFGSMLTSRDEIEANTSDETERTDADYRNTYVWGGWQQAWRGNLTSRLILALTDLDNDREGTIDDPGRRSGALDDRRTLRSAVARLDLEHRAEGLFTRLGVEGREVEARYRYASTVTYAPGFPLPGDPGGTLTRELDPDPDGHELGAYLTSRARITDRLSAEAGLRWDHQTYDDNEGPEQFAPRFNLLYDLSAGTRLRAAWGRFWQAQGVNELQVEDGVDTFYPPQRADQLILSLEQSLPRHLDLRVEAYRKDYDRVRPHYENLFDPLKLLPELEPDRVEVDPTRGRARGVELLLSRRADDPWSWWFGYGWSRVTDRIDGADVARSWDQRHTFNAGLRYAGEHWEFTLTDTYHTGWPTTQLYLAADPAGGPGVVTVGPRNADRYNDYNSLDFRVIRRFDLDDGTLEAFFEVTNTLLQRNECCTEYEVTAPAGVPVIDRDLDYWPRIIPSLGVLWKF